MRSGITVTLARDVLTAGEVLAVEADLMAHAEVAVDEIAGRNPDLAISEVPAPYKSANGEYRLMRDGEGEPQYTEVRVRAYLEYVDPSD